MGEDEPEVGEEGGGGVAASEQDVEEFAADADGVRGLADELVDEDIALGGVGFFVLGEEERTFGEAFADVGVDEVVDEGAVLVELRPFLPADQQRGEDAVAGELADVVLRAAEGGGEA
ncbi:hypothetical protein Tdes44962_MAKER08158 [Teratosphaeria destructans]|uniref:Uncharacterized protein n=1 Tax=Teratosphaeria destructans TaxID=418781 RepID=A0A9W7SXB1_9PEZI|nr:hypothetical protein Tdes44962_MAKER08158 [Teratosphaeria destructans]